MQDSTKLFSDRVDEYVKYRPGYPGEIVDLLVKRCGLTPQWRIADLGSGPGNLSRLFLAHGNPVYGIEPNKEMREAAERAFAGNPFFRSIDARAEATGLANRSVEMIVAGQAFHWFDPIPARIEAKRILQPGGWTALVWNTRRHDGSRFMEGFERTLTDLLPGYRAGKGRSHGSENVDRYFGAKPPAKAVFRQHVEHGWESFSGLVLSSSYAPKMGQPGHHALMEALRDLYDREQSGAKVQVLYETEVYYGQLQ